MNGAGNDEGGYSPVNSDPKTGAFLFISSLRPFPKGSYNGTDVVAIDNDLEDVGSFEGSRTKVLV